VSPTPTRTANEAIKTKSAERIGFSLLGAISSDGISPGRNPCRVVEAR
jgi:hypothetical protein